MRKKNYKIAAIIGCFALCLAASGQDIHFSQFYESPLTLNPALCGFFSGNLYAGIDYRDQWPSAAGSGYGFNTAEATFELHNIAKKWRNGYLSPGLTFYNDKSGAVQVGTTEVSFTLAGGVSLTENSSLAGGLQAGWAQQSITTGAGQWSNQYINGAFDPNAPSGEPSMGNSVSYADFGGGLLYSYGTSRGTMVSNDVFNVNAGISVFHISQPDISYYGQNGAGTKLYMRYVAHAEVEYGVPNNNTSLVPGFVFYQQGPAQEIDAGIKIRRKLRQQSEYTENVKSSTLDFGVYYRVGDAVILLVELEYADYAIGISYDANTSELTNASSGVGAFEISLRFINPFSSSHPGGRKDQSRSSF